MRDVSASAMTVGRLARAAGIGVEAVRYYQRRGLLPRPAAQGAFRRYSPDLIERIRFIKRAQDLGFTLEEIAGLLSLEEGADRGSIRQLAGARLQHVRQKITHLRKIETVLAGLVEQCEHSEGAAVCPIIAALNGAG